MTQLDAHTGADFFRRALTSTAKAHDGDETWWPTTRQGERTALAWSLAFEWALADRIGSRSAPVYCSTAWGGKKNYGAKLKILNHYGIQTAASRGYARYGARRMDAREYLVDLAVWAATGDGRPLLTMESEMSPNHRIEPDVAPENGYAYDYFKLLLVPSPRRIIACCVRRPSQVLELYGSLTTLTARAQEEGLLAPQDTVLSCVIVSGGGNSASSLVGVWDRRGGAFKTKAVGRGPFAD